jgi:methylmalonyl-CoA/ethylmalonyl-CoA epimerase
LGHPLISHIGIAVSNIESAAKNFGLLCSEDLPKLVTVEDQLVQVAIFAGEVGAPGGRIELVAPISQDSPVARFIAKRGEGLHHICIYVDDIKAKLAELKSAGVELIDETPRVGAEGHLIAFVHPSGMNGVLIELEQRG